MAAFLPLPHNPQATLPTHKDGEPVTSADIEKALDRDVGPIDEIQYENARWWRNVNRMMCLVGVTIIAVLVRLTTSGLNPFVTNARYIQIVLVIVSVRMQSDS